MCPRRIYQDRTATEYDGRIRKVVPGYDLIHAVLTSFVKQRPVEKPNVLIVGAGTGTETIQIATEIPTARIVAVDPSARMLDIARGKAITLGLTDRIDFRIGTLDEFDSDQLFDSVVMSFVLQLYPDDGTKVNLVRRARQRLKSDGRFFLVDATVSHSDWLRDMEVFAVKHYSVAAGFTTQDADADVLKFFEDFSPVSPQRVEAILFEGGFGEVQLFFRLLLSSAWVCRTSSNKG